MEFDVKALLETLPLMGKGMLAIFAVAAIIILTVVVLNKATQPRKK